VKALAVTFLAALVQRLAPFLDLLDARYLPLLFAYAPQAHTVYAWLKVGGAPEEIALLGGVGFEFISVGAIAWAERGAGWEQARYPAVTALVFSVAVAVAHYQPAQGALAALHAGFPLVAYAYTVMMHAPRRSTPQVTAPARASAPPDSAPAERVTAPASGALSKSARVRALAAARGVSETTMWRMVKRGEVQV
jgi:hypothetical protein